ncbi:MAG: hypothetical protein WB420_06535 [Bradyrhizobium sp.]
MKRVSRLRLLPLLLVTACTQPSFLSSSVSNSSSGAQPAGSNSPAERPTARLPIATASADQWQPPPDPVFVDESVAPSSILPSKIGECADTTITMITDRFGADLTPSKKGSDKGTFVRFSNSGFQVSLVKERSIVRSQVFDKVNMCLVEIPKGCPAGDNRGRVYKTTNLRTGESWSLPNDVKSCGGA